MTARISSGLRLVPHKVGCQLALVLAVRASRAAVDPSKVDCERRKGKEELDKTNSSHKTFPIRRRAACVLRAHRRTFVIFASSPPPKNFWSSIGRAPNYELPL
eukprot:scaffold218119_cov35-Tisochrysis_lutea.AAC.1